MGRGRPPSPGATRPLTSITPFDVEKAAARVKDDSTGAKGPSLMNRRHGAVALSAAALSISVALAGCGSSSSGAPGKGGGDANTLTVAYQRTSQFTQLDAVLKKAKTEYEAAHQGKKVNLVPIEAEQDQYFTKLALMNRSASTAPDVIYEDS